MPTKPSIHTVDLLLVLRVIGRDEEVDIDGRRLVGWRGEPELKIGEQE